MAKVYERCFRGYDPFEDTESNPTIASGNDLG